MLVIAYLVVAVTAFNRKPTLAGVPRRGTGDKRHGICRLHHEEGSSYPAGKKGISPIGKDLERVRTKTLERELAKHPSSTRWSATKTPSGKLCIEVTQRIPILRVMSANGENYYLDNKGTVMPPMQSVRCTPAVVTGNVEKSFAMRDLYKFGVFCKRILECTDRANSCIARQEHRVSARVGDHLIYLGKIADSRKLKRVKGILRKRIEPGGLEQIPCISVEFDNQIICTKKRVERDLLIVLLYQSAANSKL